MGYVLKRKVKYTTPISSVTFVFPAIFTEKGILISHLKFLFQHRSKSPSWFERNSFAIMLLLKFINTQVSNYQSATELLGSFVDALYFGTIENEQDTSNLFWRPRKSEDVNVLLGHINQYCDYLDSVYGDAIPKLNPMRKATKAEERLLWCAYYRRHSNSFFNYLNQPAESELSEVRSVYGPHRNMITSEPVFRFPKEHFPYLLNNGFACRFDKEDYCSRLILLLMHYGGLRLSECFHIYIHDVSFDTKTGESLISVFHPSDGFSPDKAFKNRREYLKVKYRIEPRNEYYRSHRLHSGWKDPLLTNKNLSFNVMFFPASKAIEFTQILSEYLTTRVDGSHPFLFSNYCGEPETIGNFRQKYARAINRIGLRLDKTSGTTCQSHRHSYGFRLKDNGASQLEIQKAMHHKSSDSCLVYIQPTDEEVREKMRNNFEE